MIKEAMAGHVNRHYLYLYTVSAPAPPFSDSLHKKRKFKDIHREPSNSGSSYNVDAKFDMFCADPHKKRFLHNKYSTLKSNNKKSRHQATNISNHYSTIYVFKCPRRSPINKPT